MFRFVQLILLDGYRWMAETDLCLGEGWYFGGCQDNRVLAGLGLAGLVVLLLRQCRVGTLSVFARL